MKNKPLREYMNTSKLDRQNHSLEYFLYGFFNTCLKDQDMEYGCHIWIEKLREQLIDDLVSSDYTTDPYVFISNTYSQINDEFCRNKEFLDYLWSQI